MRIRLTAVSPEGPEGSELVLEPNVNAVVRTFQEALAIFDDTCGNLIRIYHVLG
jgi:hypothetical protein